MWTGPNPAKTLAYGVNKDAPAHLAKACRDAGAALIHVSTDFVFDGKKTTPYTEDDPVSAKSVYGKSKAEGEEAVRGISAPPCHCPHRLAVRGPRQ